MSEPQPIVEQEPKKVEDRVRINEAKDLFVNCAFAHLCRTLYPTLFPVPLNTEELLKISNIGLSYGNDPEKIRMQVQNVVAIKQLESSLQIQQRIEEIAMDRQRVGKFINRMCHVVALGIKAEKVEEDKAAEEAAAKAVEEEKRKKKEEKRAAKAAKEAAVEQDEIAVPDEASSSSEEMPEVSSSSSSSVPEPKNVRGRGRGKK